MDKADTCYLDMKDFLVISYMSSKFLYDKILLNGVT